MNITVIGSGYVGLVTGACLAEFGNHVLCLDVDVNKIAHLQKGVIPIYEPGLEDLIKRNTAEGRLKFTTDIVESVDFGDIQYIAVGTPPDEDGSADLQYVLAAARNIGRHMTSPKIIVDKSTVPVGTADNVKITISNELEIRNINIEFSIVSNPEFLKEGAAIDDFMHPDRIVIGSDNKNSIEVMKQLYAPLVRNHDRILCMDVKSAELTKYAANAMLATRISFMNELANLAESLGADIEKVRIGIGSDQRIGYQFLYPGIGYGGSCFPKDVKALITMGTIHNKPLLVLKAVEQANEKQKFRIVDKIVKAFGNDLTNYKFALWGLAFKPNTDDMREAPSLTIIKELTKRGAEIVAYDPNAMNEALRLIGNNSNLTLASSMESALDGADALIIATEWKVFRTPDFDTIKNKLKQPIIIDGRNMYDPELIREKGFTYQAIGR